MAKRGWLAKAGMGLLLAASGAAQQVPRKAPEFTIDMVKAQPLKLSQYKGKPLLVAFILTTCSHCQHTVEILNKLLPDYAPRGLQIVGSAIDDGAQNAVAVFVKFYRPAFPVGFSPALPGGGGMSALEFCNYSLDRAPHMPILLFIDRQGTIREQHEGAEADFFGDQQEAKLRVAIESLLRPAAKPGKRK
jgi:thiol-disulfide isomerase/thioredoxin